MMTLKCGFISHLIIFGLLLAAVDAKSSAAESLDRPFLHPLFSDHVVLQRDRPLKVWGWTKPKERVTVAIHGESATTTAAEDGKWEVEIGPFEAGGPYTLTVSGPQTNVISDVLFGDVWLCSGQSNMEMNLKACDATNDIAQANFPELRLFYVPHRTSTKPIETLQGHWKPCNPATVNRHLHYYSLNEPGKGSWGGFSAIAFYFGRGLQQELKVPIGLIDAAWGGTMAEAWTSREGLQPLPEFKERLDELDAATKRIDDSSQKFAREFENWCGTNEPGTAANWAKAETDVSSWKEVNLPLTFWRDGLSDVWFRHDFELPAAYAGKDLVLSLGPIDDLDTTWVNGVQVGQENYSATERAYRVPASVLKTGRNTIAIRVLFAGGPGGFAGEANQMNLVTAGGSPADALPLAGRWRMRDLAPLEPQAAAQLPISPQRYGRTNCIASALYNGMIAPLLGFGLKGVAWYQGESNAWRARQYRELLTALIYDWRRRFGQGDIPFYIVQLSTTEKTNAAPREDSWAEIRESQARVSQTVSNSALVVTIDIGDPLGDVHYKNKREAGRRLTLCALANTYAKPVEWTGPWYKSMAVNGSQIQLAFDHVGGGLMAKGGKLTGFSIAGADHKFVWADASIKEGNTIVVSAPNVAQPAAVRYAWDIHPVCNLFNQAGLPAVPFRTDDWKMLTKDNK